MPGLPHQNPCGIAVGCCENEAYGHSYGWKKTMTILRTHPILNRLHLCTWPRLSLVFMGRESFSPAQCPSLLRWGENSMASDTHNGQHTLEEGNVVYIYICIYILYYIYIYICWHHDPGQGSPPTGSPQQKVVWIYERFSGSLQHALSMIWVVSEVTPKLSNLFENA